MFLVKVSAMKPILLACLTACLWTSTLLAQDMPCEGTWEWVSTEYADGEIRNPGTVGYGEELFFGPLGENKFIRFRNETVFEAGQWYWSSVFIGACCVEFVGTDFGDNWVWHIWEDMGVTWMRLQTGFQCPPNVGDPPTKIETFFYRGSVANQERSWGSVKAEFR
jgi:hypothetical protein